MTNEPTLHDVLEAINAFATATETRFIGIDQKFTGIDRRFDNLEQRMATKEELAQVRSEMATKENLIDLRDDLALLARRGNTKLTTLVDELMAKKSLDPVAAKRLLALEPFPQA